MVMRTIEMSFGFEPNRIQEVVRKIKNLYSELEILQEENNITVKGDLSNYKRRGMIIWILTGGNMGRIYEPVEVSFNGQKRITVGLIDTGADKTAISKKLVKEIGAHLYGRYRARCASQFILEGKYALIIIKELENGKQTEIEAGISDIPFDADGINDEGLNVILGTDFVQETGLNLLGKEEET